MNFFACGIFLAVAALGISVVGAYGGDGAPDAPSQEEIRKWINDLGSDRFEIREEATGLLKLCVPEARKLLEEATESSDPEVRYRARLILAEKEKEPPPSSPEASALRGKMPFNLVRTFVGSSVSIEEGPAGVKVEVFEEKEGKTEKHLYEAANREAFKKKHPEIYEKYLSADHKIDLRKLQVFFGVPDELLKLWEGELREGLDGMIFGQQEAARWFFDDEEEDRNARLPALPRMGVALAELPETLANHLGLSGGALIQSVVPESPAARGGLKPWDIVCAFGGQKIAAAADLKEAIRTSAPDSKIAVDIIRGGAKMALEVSLDGDGAGR